MITVTIPVKIRIGNPMAEIDDLSITDASNTARFPENMQFRNVNDSARALEGMLAREFKDRNMSLVASGSSNAFAVTSNRTITSLTDSLLIGFTANHTITGSPTLNLNGLGARTIVSQTGTALGAGDIVSGQKLQVSYRSATADFQVVGGRAAGSSADVLARVTPVGIVAPWPGTTSPNGWLFAFGQAVSRTTYSELFAVYGTTYGAGDGSTTFNIPDYRGRSVFGKDDMGSSAAGRITTAGSSVDGATLGAVGGAQNVTLTSAQMPVHTHTATVTDPGHAHPIALVAITQGTGSSAVVAANTSGAGSVGTATTGISVSNANTGSGSAHTNMPPAIVQNWIILALPALASAANTGVNGFLYQFSSSTSGAPGTGKLGFDDATLSSATGFRISETDAAGAPLGPVLATWDDSTSTVKGALYVYKVGSLSTYAVFHVTGTITDSGVYNSFTATYIGNNGTFADGDQLSVIYVPRGDAGTGADGAAGADGGGVAFDFDSSTTTAADPGTGDFRLNHATIASVTEVAFSYLSSATGTPSVETWVKSWDDSTNTTHYGTLKITKTGDPDTFAIFSVTSALTDGTTYGRFAVAYVAHSGTLTNGDAFGVHFTRTGNKGADGGGSGDVVGPAASVDSEIALFSSTTGKLLKRATTSGILKATSGVLGAAASEIDYAPATSGSAILKGNGSGGFSAAAAGTDYVAATSGSAVQKASGSGGLTAAAATDLGAGLHVIYVPATAMVSRTTNGAAAGTVETTTNKIMLKTLDFDTTTQEFAQFSVRMPKSWNEGTVTAAFTWSHASTTTNFGVVWALEGVALSDDDAGDAAFGTAQQIADTGGTTNDIYVTSATPAATIAGTPAAEDWVVFQVKRVPSDGSDTMAVDARLHGVTLYFTTDAITDA